MEIFANLVKYKQWRWRRLLSLFYDNPEKECMKESDGVSWASEYPKEVADIKVSVTVGIVIKWVLQHVREKSTRYDDCGNVSTATRK